MSKPKNLKRRLFVAAAITVLLLVTGCTFMAWVLTVGLVKLIALLIFAL